MFWRERVGEKKMNDPKETLLYHLLLYFFQYKIEEMGYDCQCKHLKATHDVKNKKINIPYTRYSRLK